MKILILTAVYSEEKGGVAAVGRLLSNGFAARGHEVSVLTSERLAGEYGARVVSQPSTVRLMREIRQADSIVLQGSVMRLAWPLLLLRKPSLLVKHIMVCGELPIRRLLSRRCTVAAVSRFLAARERPACQVLPNPYDSSIFIGGDSPRVKDVVFVGRLIKEKGAMVLLRAFERLDRQRGCTLTIIGTGPNEDECKSFVRENGLESRVDFLGHQDAGQIAQQLRLHRTLVFPSLCEEAFGLVVLEGLACGCGIIASNRGGIPEALGGHGVLFDPGDEQALFEALQSELSSPSPVDQDSIDSHLQQFAPEAVAAAYEKLMDGHPQQ
jgi:glycogen synthase